MDVIANAGMATGGGLVARPVAEMGRVGVTTKHVFECFDRDGKLKWREELDNLVVTAGLNALITSTFKASGYTAAWYVGLKGAGTVAAADTLASHAGWTEVTAYSEANRQALTLGSVTGGSADNSASKATFSINGTATVAGALVADNATKGGTTGTLYGASDFAVSRSVVSGDSLQVTATVSVTAT